jgi:predicted lactoylglutathione lyase
MQPKQIWANLAVKDVELTRKFYTEIGFTSNEGHNKTNELTSFKIGEYGFVVTSSRTSILRNREMGSRLTYQGATR